MGLFGDIGIDKLIGLIALAWLGGALLVMTRVIRSGRELADALAARHPRRYQELGRPRPGYWESASRRGFAAYVGQKGYEELEDPELQARFESYRVQERQALVFLLTSSLLVWAFVMFAQWLDIGSAG